MNFNAKLHKRTLRAKITKILYNQCNPFCKKLVQTEKTILNLDTRKTEIENEDEQIFKKLPKHPPMKFAEE